jgi:Protein of unknown function (DUF3489)
MSKTAKKQPSASSATRAPARTPPTSSDPDAQKSGPGSKQSRIIAMLRSPSGTTIAAMTKATGWQQHSVRGFLAGVVRKRLKLKLGSKKVDGDRVYRIAGGDGRKSGPRQPKHRA